MVPPITTVRGKQRLSQKHDIVAGSILKGAEINGFCEAIACLLASEKTLCANKIQAFR
jgi:hypothetical protein